MTLSPLPTDIELDKLLAAAKGGASARDRAILELLLGSGLNTSELARARRSDLTIDSLNVRGRGNQTRQVLLTHHAKFFLERYLKERRDNSPYLFVRQDRAQQGEPSRHLSMRSVQRLLERLTAAAGIRRHLTPRSLRHLFIERAMRNGADVISLAALLGHNNRDSTKRLWREMAEGPRPASI